MTHKDAKAYCLFLLRAADALSSDMVKGGFPKGGWDAHPLYKESTCLTFAAHAACGRLLGLETFGTSTRDLIEDIEAMGD